jgi:hypothetical protein
MAFCNSLQGTIMVVVLHGSSNKMTFKLDRKQFIVHFFKNGSILKFFFNSFVLRG